MTEGPDITPGWQERRDDLVARLRGERPMWVSYPTRYEDGVPVGEREWVDGRRVLYLRVLPGRRGWRSAIWRTRRARSSRREG